MVFVVTLITERPATPDISVLTAVEYHSEVDYCIKMYIFKGFFDILHDCFIESHKNLSIFFLNIH